MATKKRTTKKTSSATQTKRTATKKTTADKLKKVRQIDAAIAVLGKSKEPMTCQAMFDVMTKRKLWSSPNGKTPHATLYAALLREIKLKGKDARFKKVDQTGRPSCQWQAARDQPGTEAGRCVVRVRP